MLQWAMSATCALTLAMGGAAEGQTVTGNSLLEACQNTTDLTRIGFCTGYIIGQNEGFLAGVAVPLMQASPGITVNDLNAISQVVTGLCVPETVEYVQHLDIIVRYLQAHPETRHEPARALIYQAMREAFPCDEMPVE